MKQSTKNLILEIVVASSIIAVVYAIALSIADIWVGVL